jgi:hypothetical protein
MFKDFFSSSNEYIYGIQQLYEDVIQPGVIKLQGLDMNKLNKQYNSADIYFHKSLGKGDYNAHYDPETDEIHVYFGTSVSKLEVEAILSHELVHKEQHKRSGGKWFEQMKKEVDKINRNVELYNIAPDDLKPKIKNAFEKAKHIFEYGSPQEQMAYALQLVKERKKYNFKSPNEIAKKYKFVFNTNNMNFKKFKKYVGMYWLIKEKI